MRAKQGITFVEIMVSLVILGILIGGLLHLFLLCFQWNDASREMLIALTEVQSKLEDIRSSSINLIPAAYGPSGNPGNTFALTGLNGTGSIVVTPVFIDPDPLSIPPGQPLLLNVRVTACWRGGRNGRLFGEDVNLNGVLDAGEDRNANGLLDSPASLTDLIARR